MKKRFNGGQLCADTGGQFTADSPISKLNKREIKEDTITSILNTLPEPYKAIAAKRKKPEIPKNDRTKQLVNLLKDIGYISSYSETGKGIRVNTRLK